MNRATKIALPPPSFAVEDEAAVVEEAVGARPDDRIGAGGVALQRRRESGRGAVLRIAGQEPRAPRQAAVLRRVPAEPGVAGDLLPGSRETECRPCGSRSRRRGSCSGLRLEQAIDGSFWRCSVQSPSAPVPEMTLTLAPGVACCCAPARAMASATHRASNAPPATRRMVCARRVWDIGASRRSGRRTDEGQTSARWINDGRR